MAEGVRVASQADMERMEDALRLAHQMMLLMRDAIISQERRIRHLEGRTHGCPSDILKNIDKRRLKA